MQIAQASHTQTTEVMWHLAREQTAEEQRVETYYYIAKQVMPNQGIYMDVIQLKQNLDQV